MQTRYTITGPLNPAICRYESRAVVHSGTATIEVPADTTLEQIDWVNTNQLQEAKVVVVTGSRGDKYYVREIKPGRWTCTCQGFKFSKGRGCKHTKEVCK